MYQDLPFHKPETDVMYIFKLSLSNYILQQLFWNNNHINYVIMDLYIICLISINSKLLEVKCGFVVAIK